MTNPSLEVRPAKYCLQCSADGFCPAFRSKLREDALSGKAETNPVLYQDQTEGALKVAAFLRQNVIQAARVPGEEDTWSEFSNSITLSHLTRVNRVENHERYGTWVK